MKKFFYLIVLLFATQAFAQNAYDCNGKNTLYSFIEKQLQQETNNTNIQILSNLLNHLNSEMQNNNCTIQALTCPMLQSAYTLYSGYLPSIPEAAKQLLQDEMNEVAKQLTDANCSIPTSPAA